MWWPVVSDHSRVVHSLLWSPSQKKDLKEMGKRDVHKIIKSQNSEDWVSGLHSTLPVFINSTVFRLSLFSDNILKSGVKSGERIDERINQMESNGIKP
jgi:hypothetical protein